MKARGCCFATVHILASARPVTLRYGVKHGFATVHILASARPHAPTRTPGASALPQFTFSRQQDWQAIPAVRRAALPQFTFSRQQDNRRIGMKANTALPQFTFSRQQDVADHMSEAVMLCHSSHSRVSKTMPQMRHPLPRLCHSSHSRVSKTV